MPKCVIKARDPRLQWISIAAPSFLLSDPIPKGAVVTELIPEAISKVALPLSQVIRVATFPRIASIKEEEMVYILDSEDEFEVFNRAWSPKTSNFDLGPPFNPLIDEMGIQRKPRSTLQDLLESQPGKDEPGKAAQTKSPVPQPTLPLQLESAGLKRKREAKGKEVMEVEKNHHPL